MRRLLLVRGGVFGVWAWGLLHEERWRRPLAFIHGGLEQHSPFIYWRDFIFEEGAWHLLAVCYLEKFLAIRIHWCQLHSDQSSRTDIPVEGFYYQASQLDSGADLAVSEGAHHSFLLLAVWAWISSSSWSCYCTRFLLYCIYCIRLLLYLIYTSYLKTGFPRGGFIQGHVTKNTCVYTCILVAVRSS